MSAAATANERRSLIAATTAARLLSLIVVLAAFVVAFGPPRRAAQRLGSRLGGRIPVYFERLLCAGLRVKVRRHGTFSSAPKQLIVANHVSWLDIPVLGSLGPLAFLAKKEVGDHPIGRELVALQGVIYVDRRRRSGIPAVNARIVEAMRAGSAVVLFAEATTGDGNRVLRFRSSHFEAVRLAACSDNEGPAVIQPVYLHYSSIAGLPTVRGQRPRIAWYGDMAFLPHFFQYARGGGVTCDVYCGPPIRVLPDMDRKTAARLTESAVRELAAKARSGIAAILPAGKNA
ncbi:MAG TPA: lysophospholipid acyltransferase family protein [Roseiarcus sp.]|nr:lysophospholipid acyltransferase family protein [Roseiarcus sp.]